MSAVSHASVKVTPWLASVHPGEHADTPVTVPPLETMKEALRIVSRSGLGTVAKACRLPLSAALPIVDPKTPAQAAAQALMRQVRAHDVPPTYVRMLREDVGGRQSGTAVAGLAWRATQSATHDLKVAFPWHLALMREGLDAMNGQCALPSRQKLTLPETPEAIDDPALQAALRSWIGTNHSFRLLNLFSTTAPGGTVNVVPTDVLTFIARRDRATLDLGSTAAGRPLLAFYLSLGALYDPRPALTAAEELWSRPHLTEAAALVCVSRLADIVHRNAPPEDGGSPDQRAALHGSSLALLGFGSAEGSPPSWEDGASYRTAFATACEALIPGPDAGAAGTAEASDTPAAFMHWMLEILRRISP